MEDQLFRKDENGKFVPVEPEETPPEDLPEPVEVSTYHPDGDHYYIDRGIQDDPDWRVRCVVCRDCPHGMEVDPAVKVVDGQLIYPSRQ